MKRVRNNTKIKKQTEDERKKQKNLSGRHKKGGGRQTLLYKT